MIATGPGRFQRHRPNLTNPVGMHVGKAKADHTPELPTLDDDPRWLPIKAAHQRWVERTQDNELAFIELTKALRHDLRCRKQSATGERTLVEPAMWTPDRLMLCFGRDGLRVVERVQPGESTVLTVRGWFFVWLPDLDRFLPPPAASTPVDDDDASDEPPRRVKPGKKPREDWPTLVGQWLIEVAADDPKRLQNVDTLVGEAQDILDKEIGWSPSNTKRLRAVIVEWLKRVHR
jgi:hypothetical protein